MQALGENEPERLVARRNNDATRLQREANKTNAKRNKKKCPNRPMQIATESVCVCVRV